MRRPIVIAAGLLVAALIVAGGVVALSPAEPAGSAYTVTVAEVTVGLRQHPKQWVSRTVAVRGVAMGLSVGGGGSISSLSWGATVLRDQVPLAGPRHRFGPAFPLSVTGTGGLTQFQFNEPALILRGVGPQAPTLADRAHQFVAWIAAHLGSARRTTTYSPLPLQPRVYRLRLLAPARCPVPLAAPCYIAVAR